MIINQAFNNEPAIVKDHGFGLSKEKRTPFVWFQFEFLEIKGDQDEPVTVRADLYLHDNTLDYALRDLETLGWHGKACTELDPNEPDGHDFKGTKVYITGEMQLDPKSGKYWPKVKFINKTPHAGGIPGVDRKELQSINSKLQGKIAAYRAKNPAPMKGHTLSPNIYPNTPTSANVPGEKLPF